MYIWGSGRAAGRVGSDVLSEIAGRVVSGQRFSGSGRVQEKWPVDNSVVPCLGTASLPLELCLLFYDRSTSTFKNKLETF